MKAFTLVEVMITVSIMAFAIFGIMNVSAFYSMQAKGMIEHSDCQSQLNFAAEDLKIHFMSASGVGAMFSPMGGTVTEFTAFGEKDVYTITPNDITDNVNYTYKISKDGVNKGCLVRSTTGGGEEILVDARFSPEIQFTYTQDDPPNFMTVTITSYTKSRPLGLTNKLERRVGVRFWFINITV